MRITLSLIFGVVLNATPQAVFAHHGVNGQFDLTIEYEVSGIVTDIGWVNPHSYVYFDVTNENGEIEGWRCELRASGVLERSGWSREMFSNGTRVDIVGSPARREENTCYIQTIAFNGGEPIYRYAQLEQEQVDELLGEPPGVVPARLADNRPNISGDWAAAQRLNSREVVVQRALSGTPGMGGGMGGGPAVALTDSGTRAFAQLEAEAAAREIDDQGLTLQTGSGALDCAPRSFMNDWTFDQHPNRIIQHGDTITLRYGFMDTVRTINMDLDEPPTDVRPSVAGYSIGRWEGDVLVVETTAFSSNRFGSPRGIVVRSDQYRVTERFSLDAENQTLSRSWVAEDPLYWRDTVSGTDVISRSETPWQPYGCDDRTNENVTN